MRTKLSLGFGLLGLLGLTGCPVPTPTTPVAQASFTGELGSPLASGTTVNYSAPTDSVIAGERLYAAPAPYTNFSDGTLYALVNEPTAGSVAWGSYQPTTSTPVAIEIRHDGSSAQFQTGTYSIISGNNPGPYQMSIHQYGTNTDLTRNCYVYTGTLNITAISANLAPISSSLSAGRVPTLAMNFDVNCSVGYDSATDTILTKHLTGSVNIHP